MSPFVKICCIADVDEACDAVAHGASVLGLVSAMPSGPGVIEEASIGAIAAQVPEPVTTVLLTALRSADAIAEQHARCRTRAIQLVDAVPAGELRRLRRACPGVALWPVLHVQDASAVDAAVNLAPLADALLLDSGNPSLAVKELGGTGRTHDWAISRRIREAVDVPVILAGGLHAGNVCQAIEQVRPAGVDVCSGVRSAGVLDLARLDAFMRAVRSVGPSTP